LSGYRYVELGARQNYTPFLASESLSGYRIEDKRAQGLPSHQTGLRADLPGWGLALHQNPSAELVALAID
jgi:hypothetical protein